MKPATRTDDRDFPTWPYAMAIKPAIRLSTRQRTQCEENFPFVGPAIIAANHISEIDPLLFAEYLWRKRRAPHFLAKDALFRIPLIGKALKTSGQIPVHRGANGQNSMAAAKAIVDGGGVVVFYPEGTITRDLDAWPMKGKTGAVRLAQETGAPIIPMAQWGAMDLLDRYSTKPKLFPPTKITWRFGTPFSLEPYDLSRGEEVHRATDDLMLRITAELEYIRGPKPSQHLFNPARDKGFVKPVRGSKAKPRRNEE